MPYRIFRPLVWLLLFTPLAAHSYERQNDGPESPPARLTLSQCTSRQSHLFAEYRLPRVSRQFDYVIRILASSSLSDTDSDGYREAPGCVLIFRKHRSKPFQVIFQENLFFTLTPDNLPLANTAPLYDDQGLINTGDFNFDGNEDFAVQTGHTGSYGGPSYSVYLYSPNKQKFILNKAMSNLIEETLGFFRVDETHQRLITLSKSGCCYHETTWYAVIRNRPVPVSRTVDDRTSDDGYDYISRQRMVHGRWRGITRRVRKEPDEDARPEKPTP